MKITINNMMNKELQDDNEYEPNEDDYTMEYPYGDSIEPYDIEMEKELTDDV